MDKININIVTHKNIEGIIEWDVENKIWKGYIPSVIFDNVYFEGQGEDSVIHQFVIAVDKFLDS